MSFPAYPAYKDSGIAWLGEVPSHWEVGGLKRYVAIIGGSTPKSEIEDYWDGSIPWVTPADLSRLSDFWISDTLRKITPAGLASCGTTLVPAGSVILSTRAPIGSLGIAKVELCTNQGCKALVPSRIDEKFLAYLLSISSDELNVRGRGSTFLELSADELGAFRIAFPPPTEQQSIAAFLDRETAKIDALVAEQERLIALLREKRQAVISHAVTNGLNPNAPMRDSGVEWLGEIPSHWTVTRLSNLYREAVREGSDDLPILSVSIHHGVSDSEIPDEEMDRMVARSEDRSKYKRVQPNDLVYNMMRAWQGGFGSVRAHGQVSPAYVVAEPVSNLKSEFVEAVLRTPNAVEEMRRHSRGVTDFRLRLYWDQFKNLKIGVPPADEIDEILSRIQELVQQYDSLASVAQEVIGLLQERRAALISAAVTGKIDLRGVVSQSNVVSIDSGRPSILPPLRAVVGVYAIRELGPMGRMVVMKAGYLAEGHAGFGDLNGRYERYAAGPYDQSLIAAMERGAGEICAIVTNEPQDEGKPVTYDVPKGCQPPSDTLLALVGEDRAQRFLALLSLLKGIGRDGVEAAATLYAVWNDLLAAGKAADDDAICNGVLNGWHPAKARKFKRADLDHWLAWMRRNGLVPDGSAPRTDNQGDLFA